MKSRTIDELLARCVQVEGRIPGSPCMVWTGCKNKKGYGICFHRNRTMRVHRLAYSIVLGEIPDEMLVCHRCDNPSCVNVEHLFVGTNLDNLRDMVKKGRSTRGERNHSAKLTEKQVQEIRVGYTGRGYAVAVANKYGISPGHVRELISGKKWKHLPQPAA